MNNINNNYKKNYPKDGRFSLHHNIPNLYGNIIGKRIGLFQSREIPPSNRKTTGLFERYELFIPQPDQIDYPDPKNMLTYVSPSRFRSRTNATLFLIGIYPALQKNLRFEVRPDPD